MPAMRINSHSIFATLIFTVIATINLPFSVLAQASTSSATSFSAGAVQTKQDSNEVSSVSLEGIVSRKLNAPIRSGGDVWEYYLSPDGSQIVYQGNIDNDSRLEAYAVPVTGGETVKLAPSYADSEIGISANVKFSADGSHVVYVNGLHQLWSIDLNPAYAGQSSPTQLSGYYTGKLFAISPDGQKVVFYRWENPNSPSTYPIFYQIPISGGTPIEIPAPVPDSGTNSAGIHISAEAFQEVHQADLEMSQSLDSIGKRDAASAFSEKFSANLDKLAIQSEACFWYFDLKISNDSQFAVLQVMALNKIPLSGGSGTRLAGTPENSLGVNGFLISEDNNFAVYRAGCTTEGANDLYSVPFTGGDPTQLNATLPISGTVTDFQISQDSAQVVYKVGQSEDEAFDLYSVPITGGVPIKLNSTLVTGGTVLDYAITADGKAVVYRANQDTKDVVELYEVSILGGAPKKLNAPLVSGGNVIDFVLAGNNRVLYRADQETDEMGELYSVAFGDGAITKLSGTVQPMGSVVEFSVSQDGSFAVYRADQETDEVYELYAVPVEGDDPLKLNLPLVTGGDVMDYAISADNTHIVYRADQETDDRFELYASEIVAFTLFLPIVQRG